MKENDETKSLFELERLDAKEGFPRYCQYVEQLTFKEKIIEYINVSTKPKGKERHEIIYNSFDFKQRKDFRDKYEDIIETVHTVYNMIVNEVRAINEFAGKAESNLREVFVYESNIRWFNFLLASSISSLNGREPDEQTSFLLREIESYRSPIEQIKVTKNEKSGLLEIDFEEFSPSIKNNIESIRVLMSSSKALFASTRSFLEEVKLKYLFPSYMKEAELYLNGFEVRNEYFSSFRGNQIRKKPKNARTKHEVFLLDVIEKNESRGFTFPIYANVEPDETLRDYCKKEWLRRTQE